MKTTYLIQPLSQLVIRKNTLIGFENETCLDKLKKDSLGFKTTVYKEQGVSHKKMLKKYCGSRGIPKSGWVEIQFDHSKENIHSVWKQAMDKIRNGEVINVA